jgi:hypothetical protein
MRKIRITSVLPVSFRDELERIVFFNPEQNRVTAPLIASLQRYGVPTIVEEKGCLRFRVNAFGRLQSLYAFDVVDTPPRLVGVAMFIREKPSSIVVLHIAAHEDYTSQGKKADVAVVSQLLVAVRNASARTHGVRTLKILYPREIKLDIRPCHSVPVVSKPTRKSSRKLPNHRIS